jgi:hypothetical protein
MTERDVQILWVRWRLLKRHDARERLIAYFGYLIGDTLSTLPDGQIGHLSREDQLCAGAVGLISAVDQLDSVGAVWEVEAMLRIRSCILELAQGVR